MCWTLAGYASGFASYVFQTDMICVEHACVGRGDDHCAWTLMNAADCAPEFSGLRKYFQPLNIKDRINVLEGIECGNRPEGGAWFRIYLPADATGADTSMP